MAVSPPRLESTHFPYLPVRITVRDRSADVEALLDTGFDGTVIVPAHLLTNGYPAELQLRFTLADQSVVYAPTYRGSVQLPGFAPVRVLISVMRDEPIVGPRFSNRYSIHLDHGRRIIVEP